MSGAFEFELTGEGIAVTYQPGDRLEIRRGSRSETYWARELTIESVAVGQVISTRAADGFALLLPDVPPGGGELSAVALTHPPGSPGWVPTTLAGRAGALAGKAAREAALSGAGRPDAPAGSLGKALPFTVSTTFAADKLLPSDSGPSADDAPQPHHPDWPDPLHLHDDGPFHDPFGDQDDDPILPGQHDMT